MKTFPWFIIAILLLVILYLRECSPKPECPPTNVRVDTIPGDTIIHDTTIYKPTLVYRDTGSTRWLYQKIDTAAILAACLAVNHYRDTLMNDTSALVVVENEVSMNELKRISLEYTNRVKVLNYKVDLRCNNKQKIFLYGPSIIFKDDQLVPGISGSIGYKRTFVCLGLFANHRSYWLSASLSFKLKQD